jgi:membrane associated rhomboid family serine protease
MVKNKEQSNETQYFKELLKEYHLAKNGKSTKGEKNQDKLIALTLALSQYYYEHNEMIKAKHHLNEILELNSQVENVHLYLGLIALYENKNPLALEEVEKELEINPKNSFAKELQEKIHVGTTLPIMTILISLLLLSMSYFLGGTLTTTQLFTWGLNSSNITFLNSISSIFIHTSWLHVGVNIIILFLFGHLLEKYIGPLYFTIIFILSAIIGNLSQALFYPGIGGFVVGASGGMFGLLGALLMRNPLLETKLFGIIKTPLIYILGALFTFSIIVPTTLFQAAEISHIFGLFSGILLTGFLYQENVGVFYNWIFVTLGFILLITGVQSLLTQNNIYTIILSTITASLGMFLSYYSYESLQRAFLKKGDLK